MKVTPADTDGVDAQPHLPRSGCAHRPRLKPQILDAVQHRGGARHLTARRVAWRGHC
jgi:hypothetical protein